MTNYPITIPNIINPIPGTDFIDTLFRQDLGVDDLYGLSPFFEKQCPRATITHRADILEELLTSPEAILAITKAENLFHKNYDMNYYNRGNSLVRLATFVSAVEYSEGISFKSEGLQQVSTFLKAIGETTNFRNAACEVKKWYDAPSLELRVMFDCFFIPSYSIHDSVEVRIKSLGYKFPEINEYLQPSSQYSDTYKDTIKDIEKNLTNIIFLIITQENRLAMREKSTFLDRITSTRKYKHLPDFIDEIKRVEGVDITIIPKQPNGVRVEYKFIFVEDKKESLQKRLDSRLLTDELSYGQFDYSTRRSTNAIDRINEDINYIRHKILEFHFFPYWESNLKSIKATYSLHEQLGTYIYATHFFLDLQNRGYSICRSQILDRECRTMNIRNARSLLLRENDVSKNIPNNIHYDPEKNIFVITGANNGGKSTYVKTIGLLQLMAQSGLYVVAEAAEVSLVDCIYTHTVRLDDVVSGGRFENEMKRMRTIFEYATKYSLILIDEPCGGTSYEEAINQSLVLTAGFQKLGCTVFFTTHLHPFAGEIEKGQFQRAGNLHVAVADIDGKLTYTYQIEEGPAMKSFGKELAKAMGLDGESINILLERRAKEEGFQLRNGC